MASQEAVERPRPVVELHDVTRTYGEGETAVHALRGVSLRVERGEYVAIMGASGSGKSTLMNLLGCLDVPTTGSYLLDGVDVATLDDDALALVRNRKVGFVFQSFNLIPRMTAFANVELPLIYAGLGPRQRRARAEAALSLVGLSDRASHEPNALSGGQQQRVAVARALVTSPTLLPDEPTGNLDSSATADVLSVFDGLHASGRTLVVITHEPDVSARAGRIVRLRDGGVVEDERRDGSADGRAPLPGPRSGRVTPREVLRSALRGLAANRMRSALTCLGILIGVGAVIVLVAVGNGSGKQVQASIDQLGTNTLTIFSGGIGRFASRGSVQASNTDLTIPIAAALADPVGAPDISTVTPEVNGSATVTYSGATHTTSVVGTYPTYFAATNSPVQEGRGISGDDVERVSRSAVVGQTVATDLFGTASPIGKQMMIGGVPFTVVGELAQKDATGPVDANDTVIVPLTAAQASITGYGPISSIVVQATGPHTVDAAQAEATAILDRKLHVTNAASAPYQILNQSQLLATRTATSRTFTVLLAAVAGISLLVGGIGITNIMLVTVTERTREIGIRKALGATRRAVLGQFLAEATLLSLLGGLLGVVGGAIGTQFEIVGIHPVIVPASIALALGVAVLIGIFFGSYPANRAAGLRPVEALRHE